MLRRGRWTGTQVAQEALAIPRGRVRGDQAAAAVVAPCLEDADIAISRHHRADALHQRHPRANGDRSG